MTDFRLQRFPNSDSNTHVSKQLGEIFREARTQRQLSQCSLSEAANVNNSYYCLIENGAVNLTVRKFLCICDGLQIEPEVIMRLLSNAIHRSGSNDDQL